MGSPDIGLTKNSFFGVDVSQILSAGGCCCWLVEYALWEKFIYRDFVTST